MDVLVQNLTVIIAIIGVLAFFVSIITEVFKGVGFLSKIPTDIVVLILLIGITVVAFIAYMQYIQQTKLNDPLKMVYRSTNYAKIFW